MIVYNLDSIGNYVSIEPLKARFIDEVDCNGLCAVIINDNLTDGCVVKYTLLNVSGVNATTVFSRTLSITGDDYKSWDGNNEYVYSYIATRLNLTII